MKESSAQQLCFKVSLDNFLIDDTDRNLTGDYFLTYAGQKNQCFRWEMLTVEQTISLAMTLKPRKDGDSVEVVLESEDLMLRWRNKSVKNLSQPFHLKPTKSPSAGTTAEPITCVAVPTTPSQGQHIDRPREGARGGSVSSGYWAKGAAERTVSSYYYVPPGPRRSVSSRYAFRVGGAVAQYLKITIDPVEPVDYYLQLEAHFDAAYGVEFNSVSPDLRLGAVLLSHRDFHFHVHHIGNSKLELVLRLERGEVNVIEACPTTIFETYVATRDQTDEAMILNALRK